MQRIDGENWLRLHLAGRDSVSLRLLVRRFGTATELMEHEPEALFADGIIDKAVRDRLIRAHSQSVMRKVNETVEICRRNGWRIITPQSELYPERLLKLRRFPFVLYADGDTALLNGSAKCAMVGTRNASQNARVFAYKLAYGLSEAGVSVVSGGALGIDAASHEGALSGSTGTIAVLGAGLGSGYLQKNAELRNRIASHGVLISELQPFETPTKYTFPERNRIIASLGDVCCVVESGSNGGSLITAERARELDRTIAVPTEGIFSSDGCRRLASDGAKCVSSAVDVMELIGIKPNGAVPEAAQMSAAPDYNVDFSLPGFKKFFFGENETERRSDVPKRQKKAVRSEEKSERRERQEKKSPSRPEKRLFNEADEPNLFTVMPMSEEEKTVLAALTDEPVSLDKIVEKTGIGTDAVTSSLTLLELRGAASSYYGNLYSLKKHPAEAE